LLVLAESTAVYGIAQRFSVDISIKWLSLEGLEMRAQPFFELIDFTFITYIADVCSDGWPWLLA